MHLLPPCTLPHREDVTAVRPRHRCGDCHLPGQSHQGEVVRRGRSTVRGHDEAVWSTHVSLKSAETVTPEIRVLGDGFDVWTRWRDWW